MNKLSIPMSRTENLLMWCYLFFETFVLATVLYLVNLLLPVPLSDAMLNVAYFVINFLFTAIVCRKFLIKSVLKAASHPFQFLKYAFLGFVLYYIGSILVSYLILYLRPDYFNANDANIADMSQENYPLISLCTIVLVPPVEEVLYRGLIFRRLYNHNHIAAYAVSSVVFSAIHVTGYIGLHEPMMLLLSLLQYIPAGLCLGWAYAKSDTIATPILIHMTINQIAMLSMR